MKVLRIQAQDAYSIRKSVLPLQENDEYYRYPGDMDEKTFHLGLFEENQLLAVASFYFEKNPDLLAAYQYRLRGLATRPDYQKKGLGQVLLQTAFPHIIGNQGTLLWANAREGTYNFFLKVGFKTFGSSFTIEDQGAFQLFFIELDQ